MKRALLVLGLLIPLSGLADVVVPADRVEDSVNIRLDPDTSSDVVGKLAKGTSLPHVGSVDGWHEVQLEGGATGFVSADWSKVESDSVPEAATVDVAAEEVVEEVVEEAAADVVEEAVIESVVEAVEDVVEEVSPAPEPEPVPEPQPVPELEPVVEAEFAEPQEAPPAPPAATSLEIKADRDYVVKLRKEGELGNSQLFDDGNRVGIGTSAPEQRLEVNGSIRIHDQNSNVAGLMITQSSGETGYVMHNRASTLTIGAGSIDRITIDRDGNVGFGVSRPSHPLEMASGAYVTAGGVWTNRSSRESKENIAMLTSDDALAAVMALEPVTFTYRVEQGEDYVGFIAEDVPAELASSDGQSLSTMDLVAALTKVVQEQQRRIEDLEARLAVEVDETARPQE
ncbi:MAG: tail fiber domain-containing protein [Woeseiaceae bacterium]|nr:tail fiber domain-containing protein [Woeseiaceae bacterium]